MGLQLKNKKTLPSKNINIYLLVFLAIFLWHNNTKANNLFLPKTQTPSRLFSAQLSIPDEFGKSNDLTTKAGSFYSAVGEKIIIQGKVTDSFGVPIGGAIIEIWQTNSSGKYQNLLGPNSVLIDHDFTMSGRTITNNLGNYTFLTIMPGYYINRTPHVNLNIYHDKFGKIETEIYFENHPRNRFDAQYLSYNKKEKELLTAKVRLQDIYDSKSTKICIFDITMDGVHQYKSF